MELKRGRRSGGISSSIFNSKKGQVTIFIIIGIVIVFTFAAILYVTKGSTTETLTTEGVPISASVQQEFRPIQAYTENCLSQVGKRGLQVLGQQGGYIYSDILGDFNPNDPTNSAGLNLQPVKVPYWIYNPELNGNNKVSLTSLQPELSGNSDTSIEKQLARFVDEKINDCLDNYTAFKQQEFQISDPESGNSVVKIGNKGVTFSYRRALTIQRGSAEVTLNEFVVSIPLQLKSYYGVAVQITEAEKEFGFIENQALGLIDVFSAIDRQKLPPKDAVSFELISTTFWDTKSVKDKVISMLSSYVPLLQMVGAHNVFRYEFPVSDLSNVNQQNYDNMIIPLRGAENMEVRFDYFGWEQYLHVTNEDGMVKSQEIFVESKWGITPSFGMQRFYTSYDLSYPVLLTIDDPLAFDGEGYQFNVAFESNIRNNKRVEAEEILPPPVTAFRNSIACQENQKTTEMIRAKIVDAQTGQPLDAVRIGFTIPDQDECAMGLTDNQGQFESKFPSVYGGVVNLIKNDYLTAYYPVDTYPTQDKQTIIGYAAADLSEPVIEMYPFKSLNVSVKKEKLGKCIRPLLCKYTVGVAATVIPYKEITCQETKQECFFDNGLFDLPEPVASFNATGSLTKFNDYYFLGGKNLDMTNEESVFITLTKVKDVNPNIKTAEYTATFQVDGNTKSDERLVPVVYNVQGMLSLHKEVVIPTDHRSTKIDIPIWDKEINTKVDESATSDYVEGMIEWSTPDTYITITPDQLYGSKEITFYIPSQEILSIPKKTKTIVMECGSITCLPGLGCVENACIIKDQEINGIVVEDLQLLGKMVDISRMPDVRLALEPSYK